LLYKQASKLKGHRLDVHEGQTTMSWLQTWGLGHTKL
jgi:hypothetical protein